MSYYVAEIPAWDKRGRERMDALLAAEGIRRDRNLDYSCGVFDEDEGLIAAGSSFGSTLRCLAVSSGHRGEGLMNLVVSHLTERLFALGRTHVFLYTKTKNDRIFRDMGFYEIARVGNDLVFMENRREGFPRFLSELESTKREGDSAAIVMNANPFTKGHRYLVERACRESGSVHLFLLSEEAGPIPFAVRKRLVKEGTADLDNLVIHDSGPYMISSATFPSYFLRDEDAAILAHAKLDIAVFGRIAEALGVTARYAGEERTSRVTALYNSVMAEELPKMGIEFREIPRLLASSGEAVSASAVRQAIKEDALDRVSEMLPPSTLAYFESEEAAPVIAAIREMREARHY